MRSEGLITTAANKVFHVAKGMPIKLYLAALMEIVSHILIGLVMAYAGLLPPGMMNMTVVHHTLASGLSPALRFASGASLVIAIQALIALSFAQWLIDHPSIILTMKQLAIWVFLLLAIYFFYLARKPIRRKISTSMHKIFWAGVGLASMNMLAIPFFLAYSTWMELEGWISIQYPFIPAFVLGATSGAYLLFLTYAFFAGWISRRAQFITRNINYILSALFIFLAITTTVNLYF